MLSAPAAATPAGGETAVEITAAAGSSPSKELDFGNPRSNISGKPARHVARVVKSFFEKGSVEGHRARRLIDANDAAENDPFLIMAEDYVPHGAFGLHPHRGIETVTLVLDGALEHFDNAGNAGRIEVSDAQWMTAGRGVIHNEGVTPGTTAHALQLWINLPAALKMTSRAIRA
jgi:redox-sensitive bicupin YhaK (pirin superfamily)